MVPSLAVSNSDIHSVPKEDGLTGEIPSLGVPGTPITIPGRSRLAFRNEAFFIAQHAACVVGRFATWIADWKPEKPRVFEMRPADWD
jgi:hypothetical protein